MSNRADASHSVLLTPEQMSAADEAAIAAGARGADLMEAAGLAVAATVRRHWPMGPVTVLCGPGNNGGDGFVAARHLRAWGWPVRLGLLGSADSLTPDAAHHAALWGDAIEPFDVGLLDGASVVVDALFGAGLARPIEGPALEVLREVAHRSLPVCAVDVPSGLDGATGQVLGMAVPARHTVTFFRKKPGHVLLPGRQLCGQITLADIGIPPQVVEGMDEIAFENEPALWRDMFPWPRADDHKYARGHVLVVGGEIMTGAARLSAMAAARAGAGLVTVAAPAPVWPVYAAALTSVMVQPLDDASNLNDILADARKNVLVVGPGAGVSEATRQHVLAALDTGRGVVLDADAITSFGPAPQALFSAIKGPCVLTPHEGEYSRLFAGHGSKLERARQAARQSGAVVLLKGADTVIASPDGRAVINSNAPPTLATGGTGDVLTGFIAGLMAQGMAPFLAASAGAWLHGEAARQFGPGLVSEDLPAMLPRVLRRLKAYPSTPGVTLAVPT
ncbi:NAD(P)H-hydrate dehydratase [Pusillimonas sp.]|uniref:NAD(P)H-hydrate dehydratase n=1 Tax=Pusillimonas sp. TaxID=3040095 RepID=UPI0029A12B2C|nr:NAD(P)H-hydrate dehydratase [Pusillimonas sp.]MDX3895708.1 NAD(P)H-hydrate dehydratase [Pusillimonas sp.]